MRCASSSIWATWPWPLFGAAAPSRLVYVACDPLSLARDVAFFAGHGYRLGELRAFDLFPMTAHVECVAQLVRDGT